MSCLKVWNHITSDGLKDVVEPASASFCPISGFEVSVSALAGTVGFAGLIIPFFVFFARLPMCAVSCFVYLVYSWNVNVGWRRCRVGSYSALQYVDMRPQSEK
jgi:hypothetical protein